MYTSKQVEGLVREYQALLDERDNTDVHVALLDLEKALLNLSYEYVMPIYSHGFKQEPLRRIEQRTGVPRETLRRQFYKGVDLLTEIMNDQTRSN